MIIDLSLKNTTLYEGCTIESVAGRLNLTTPPVEAVEMVGRNIAAMVAAESDRSVVTMTGPMAVWAYCIVFHAVVHSFTEVRYDDGRNPVLTLARHG